MHLYMFIGPSLMRTSMRSGVLAREKATPAVRLQSELEPTEGWERQHGRMGKRRSALATLALTASLRPVHILTSLISLSKENIHKHAKA